MTKQQTLDLLMLLSALESWSLSVDKHLPDYMYEKMQNAVELLTKSMVDE